MLYDGLHIITRCVPKNQILFKSCIMCLHCLKYYCVKTREKYIYHCFSTTLTSYLQKCQVGYGFAIHIIRIQLNINFSSTPIFYFIS